jgi:hypothetical protein
MLKKYNLACYLLLGFWLVFFDVSVSSAAETVGQNIALGTSYTFSQAPNYGPSTEAGDSTQLTDGNHVSGYFLTQAGIVGWTNKPTVDITFDLGADKPIEGLAFNTSANTYSAEWPTLIFMFVSDDNINWYALGNLVEADFAQSTAPTPFKYAIHQYTTRELAVHGRYVKLFSTANYFLISDEVEIYRGPDEYLYSPLPGVALTDVATYVDSETPSARVRLRLLKDIQGVNTEIAAVTLASAITDPMKLVLSSISQQVPTITTLPLDFTTVFPINDLHRQIFQVQASLWQALGLNDIIAWKTSRYDLLSPTDIPPQNTVEMKVVMMSNEYRSDVINLSNTKASATELTLTIEGLPGGDNPGYVTVHESPFTDTRGLTPVNAVLPVVAKKNGRYVVTVPAGLTKQIWLSFHPTDVAAGIYLGNIKIEGSGITTLNIHVSLEIYPFRFPEKPTFHLGGYDFTNISYMGITSANKAAFIQTLQEHYVDTPWASGSNGLILPAGNFDSSGHMITDPDPSAFNAWRVQWPTASNYFIWTNFGSVWNFAASKFPVGSMAFQVAIKEWTTWWATYLQSQNIAPSRLGLLIWDEPSDAYQPVEATNAIITYGNAIRSAGTGIRVFENPRWTDTSAVDPQVFVVSDILSLYLGEFVWANSTFKDFYAQQRLAGKELWFYNANGPILSLDPYTYNLSAAWFSWRYEAKGFQIWAFGDTGERIGGAAAGNSWNEYDSRSRSYTPLFIDSQTITDAKHMEALREGVEDYEYLKMLQDRITALEGAGISDPVIDNAKAVLQSGVTRVTDTKLGPSKDYWNITKDRTVADQVRVEILEALKQLNLVKLPDPSASIFAKDSLKIANKKVTFGQAKKINTKSKTISFKGNNSLIANGSVQLYRGSTLVQTASADTTGTWSIKIKEKKDTTVTFYLRYLDGVGVELGTSAGYKIKIDTQKPKITNLPIFLTKTKGAKIWWEAKDNVKVTSYKISFLGKTKTTKSKAFTVPLDAPSGLHILTLKAYDAMGNSTSRLVTVRVR